MALVQREVGLRFNTTTVANLSHCNTTNAIESIWSQVVKHSQGKRLNQNYSISWEVCINIAIISMSLSNNLPVLTFIQNQMGVGSRELQLQFRERKTARLQKIKSTKQSKKAMLTRKYRKIVKSNLGSNQNADYEYKSEKVYKEKSNKENNSHQPRKCGICNRFGHIRQKYNIPEKIPANINNFWIDETCEIIK